MIYKNHEKIPRYGSSKAIHHLSRIKTKLDGITKALSYTAKRTCFVGDRLGVGGGERALKWILCISNIINESSHDYISVRGSFHAYITVRVRFKNKVLLSNKMFVGRKKMTIPSI